MKKNINASLVAVLLFALSTTAFAQVYDSGATTFTHRSGVKIHLTTSSDMFPSSWMGGDIQARATDLDYSERARSVENITNALNKYPKKVLRENIKNIYVVKEMSFYGVGYGGTRSSDDVYIANAGKSEGYTDYFIESSFHHEFSSILYFNYGEYFDEEKWQSIHPAGFRYLGDGTQAIKEGKDSVAFEKKYHLKGFLSEYGQASIEEDYNTFSENLFFAKPGFWDIVDSHPKVKAKMKVLIDFYSKIHPDFTEKHFRRVSTLHRK